MGDKCVRGQNSLKDSDKMKNTRTRLIWKIMNAWYYVYVNQKYYELQLFLWFCATHFNRLQLIRFISAKWIRTFWHFLKCSLQNALYHCIFWYSLYHVSFHQITQYLWFIPIIDVTSIHYVHMCTMCLKRHRIIQLHMADFLSLEFFYLFISYFCKWQLPVLKTTFHKISRHKHEA